MKIKNLTPYLTAALVVMFGSGVAQAERVYLQVDRGTGAVSAVASSDVQIDGYSISSKSGLLDPENWNSLATQGSAGWEKANPRIEQLSELNWEGTGSLTAGEAVSLGNAFGAAGVLPSSEDLTFNYSTPDGVFGTGAVVYTGTPQVPGITVDRQSGQIQIVNPLGFDLAGYSILSEGGSLSVENFSSLTDQGNAGWTVAGPSNNGLSELSLESSITVNGSSPINLGGAFAPGSAEDLVFEYSTTTEFGNGLVTYQGLPNDLTLQVNLLSGAAALVTPSSLSGDLDLTGYNIVSASGALSVENWTSLADGGGAGWTEAVPTSNSLAELNAESSTIFSGESSISLGNVFIGADAQPDLVFEYSVGAGTVQSGNIEYFLGDGAVGGPTCADIAETRIPGDANGNNEVEFTDFLVLANNFGGPGGYEDGNFDCLGDVDFVDFLTLANNFGRTSAASAASVPEPSSSVLLFLGAFVCLAVRRKVRR